MTYGPMSTSYLTTSFDSSGLYDTTALTEQITTSTVYETDTISNQSYMSKVARRTFYKSGSLAQIYFSTSMKGPITSTKYTSRTTGPFTNSVIFDDFTGFTGAALSIYGSFTHIETYNSNYNTNSYTTKSTVLFMTNTSSSRKTNTNVTTSMTYRYVSENDINAVEYATQSNIFNNGLYTRTTGNIYTQYISVDLRSVITKTTNTIYETAESTTAYSGIFSSIQSGSSSWYTSNEDGSGLYNTTALTRESTSNTSYLTVESTTGTSYETVSTDSYISILQTWLSTNYNGYNESWTISYNSIIKGDVTSSITSKALYTDGYRSSGTVIKVSGSLSRTNYMSTTSSQYNTFTWTNSSTTTGNYIQLFTTDVYSTFSLGNTRTTMVSFTINANTDDGQKILLKSQYKYSNAEANYVGNEFHTNHATFFTNGVSTTGTIYLTDEVITGTSYLTCESTSGYSGISSSSSIAYGWL